MEFDFSSIIDRRGWDALSLDSVGGPYPNTPAAPEDGFDVIPMWIADMNFSTAPSVIDALRVRISHPLFGYFYPSKEAYSSIIRWQRLRNDVTGLLDSDISFHNGLLGGLLSAISTVASPGDHILLHSPTYTGFTNTLSNAGYRIVLSPLVRDSNGMYRMDYEDMDRKLRDYGVKAAILCSPHNPTGRVWAKSEIFRAMSIFESHSCLVVADEIWSDIVLLGSSHVPTQSVCEYARDNVVALYAPSKTFNIAGLPGAYSIIYNESLRQRVESQASKSHYNEMNVLSMHAMIGGYSDAGALWVDSLLEVLASNVDTCCDFFSSLPGVTFSRPQGTYMLYLDFTGWCAQNACSLDELLQRGWRVGVAWQDGRPFHGSCHIRMNVALPREKLDEALSRLRIHVFND